jgi:two-component system sensor histidine kinase AlgZ
VQGEFSAGIEDGLYQVRITLPPPLFSPEKPPAATPRQRARTP